MTAPAARPISAYQRLLLQARQLGINTGRAELQRIQQSLALAVSDLDAIAASDLSTITTERASGLRQEIGSVMGALERRLGATGDASIRQTVAQIVTLHRDGTIAMRAAAGAATSATYGASFTRVNLNVLSTLAARRGGTARTYQALISRHMRDAAPALDRVIEAGIARGQSIPSLAKDVGRLIQGLAPDELRGVPRLGGLRTVGADARMIARSETMNALREANRQSVMNSGMVAAMRWQLNSAHSIPCDCEDLADQDNGWGPGFWAPEDWPLAPHPHCGCYQGETILKDVEDW